MPEMVKWNFIKKCNYSVNKKPNGEVVPVRDFRAQINK